MARGGLRGERGWNGTNSGRAALEADERLPLGGRLAEYLQQVETRPRIAKQRLKHAAHKGETCRVAQGRLLVGQELVQRVVSEPHARAVLRDHPGDLPQ